MIPVTSFLNRVTMYWLMMYFLIVLVAVAAVESFLGILPYNPLDILLEAFYLVVVCRIVNEILARILKAKTNPESPIITGLILSLIIGPINWIPAFAGMTEGISGITRNILLLTAVSVLAMVSKYLIAFRKRHIFNPAAFGALAVGLLLHQGASWWIGSLQTFPFLLIGGLLILKKIRRFELVGVFLLIEIATLILFARNDIVGLLLSSPLLFFTFVMLVEPQTSPLRLRPQILYAILVAAFFYIFGNGLGFPYPLEAALLVGNLFSYLACRSFRLTMILKEKKQLTKDVIAFKFEPSRNFQFKPGQFLEWTLSHPKPDSRGVRRFFTISSSPTENFIMLASKFYEKPSTFKQALQKLEVGQEIVISGLRGDFSLPDDKSKKLVFIAGGIGVTPFRSMVKYLVDKKEKRDILMLYSNKTATDIVFKDLFDKANDFGLGTVYANTDVDGYIDEAVIRKQVPDFAQRIFYVSGPEPMVEAFVNMLKGLGVAGIKRDYFPGYTETHQKI